MALTTPFRPLVTWAASFALTAPVFGLALSPMVAHAEVPGAPRLLPEQTYIYARVENANELRKDMADSSVGKMMADPKLRPFAGDIYNTAAELFQQVGGQLGLTLDELLAIPQGQVAFGLVNTRSSSAAAADAPKDESPEAIRRRLAERQRDQGGIGAMLLIETGDRNEALFNLLDELEERIARSGAVGRSETIGSTTVRRLVDPGSGDSRLEYFHRDGATVIGFGRNVATDALARWDGNASGKSLAESTDFAAVMSRCIGAADTRPQMTFFADPYRLARRAVAQGGVGAGLIWQIFEDLGVSKVRGMGASTFHGGDTFADIAHAHIMIDPPRDGIFSVLRPKAGDTNPPNWVPEDITGYVSLGWRADATYDGLGRILDQFQGEGALGRLVEEPYKTRIGGDFRASIIDALDDRIVMIQWLQPPVRINSSVSINAVKLKDAAAATKTVEEVASRFPAQIRKEPIGVHTLYLFGNGDGSAQIPEGLRRPTPCAMILDDWLLTSDSREFIERAIRARDGAIPRLSELPEYDLVASELGGQLGADKPFMLSFSRSSQVLRQVYELAKSDQTRSFLQTRGEANPVARSVSEMMKRNQLPPFEEFEKYFAPSGGFAYDEPSGIHFGRYTLKASE
jgi:hypothetical protein